MILLPKWFGTRPLSQRAGKIAAALLIAGFLSEIVGFLTMRTIGYRWAALWGVGALMLLCGAALIVLKGHVLSSRLLESRSSKFVKAAHLWLLISLSMLVLLPVWQFLILPALAAESHAVEIGFSHAYYGAIRHAITVGFISLMILGMSARLMERLIGEKNVPSGSLMIPFVLVNVGCAMRVGFQALTDIHPLAFAPAGISGMLELTGISIWALWMLRAMYAKTGSIG